MWKTKKFYAPEMSTCVKTTGDNGWIVIVGIGTHINVSAFKPLRLGRTRASTPYIL